MQSGISHLFFWVITMSKNGMRHPVKLVEGVPMMRFVRSHVPETKIVSLHF